MFPDYLFFDLDSAGEHWKRINSTFGVRRLFTRGEKRQHLPSAFVEKLRTGVDEIGICRVHDGNLED